MPIIVFNASIRPAGGVYVRSPTLVCGPSVECPPSASPHLLSLPLIDMPGARNVEAVSPRPASFRRLRTCIVVLPVKNHTLKLIRKAPYFSLIARRFDTL